MLQHETDMPAADVRWLHQVFQQGFPQFVWRVAQKLEPVLGLSAVDCCGLESGIPLQSLCESVERIRVGVHVELAEGIEVGEKSSGYRRLVQLPACGFLDSGEGEEELAAVTSGRADDAAFIPSIDAGQAPVGDHRGEFDPADRTGIPDVLSHTLDRERPRFGIGFGAVMKQLLHPRGIARGRETQGAPRCEPTLHRCHILEPQLFESEGDVRGGSAGGAHQDQRGRVAIACEPF